MADKSLLGRWISNLFSPTEKETTYLHKGEILIVFLVGFFIALSMWFLVNLGRDYNITMNIPLDVKEATEEMTFAELPPEFARIGVSGEGWNLLSLYRNPPEIVIPYDEGIISITNIVKEQLSGHPDLTVTEVVPSFITIEMEPVISKRVPVRLQLDIETQARFEIMGNIRINPDSITVTGAKSIVDTMTSWPTSYLKLRNVQDRFSREVSLVDHDLYVKKDTSTVHVTFDVTELTEGEIRVYVRARNIPVDREVRFNPSVITVRYNVPIENFSAAQDIVPYEAFVEYDELVQDTTGFLVPTVRPTTDELDLRLRSFQPRSVSYFHVIKAE